MKEKLREIARKYKLQFYAFWDIEGGNGWIWFKQEDERKFTIQINTHDPYDIYKMIKTEVVELFKSYGYTLADERDEGSSFGYRKNLYFIGTEDLMALRKKEESMLNAKQPQIFNIGQINADGGIVTLGDVTNSTQKIENSIKRIELQIEEKGEDDKEELFTILREAEIILTEISRTNLIKPEIGFMQKLNNHLAKHGWFYGAILQLFGTVVLGGLGGGQ